MKTTNQRLLILRAKAEEGTATSIEKFELYLCGKDER